MKLDHMKKSIPETPEFIHEMIQKEVEKQLQETTVIQMQTRRGKRWTGARIAAVAAVCVLATSTVAYAGVKLYHMQVEKQGDYSVSTGIKSEEGSDKREIPEKIHDVDITLGYIPEGMKWVNELQVKYPEQDRPGGFTFSYLLLDNVDLSKVMQDNNVVDCEQKIFGNYEGVYLKYHTLEERGTFNQRIYLLCPDEYRIITIYIGDDVAKEEAIKVAENLVLTENDRMIETAEMDTWREKGSMEEVAGELVKSIGDNELPIYPIGSTLGLSAVGEDSDGNYIREDQILAHVDSVQIADDLHLLDGEHLPEEWSDMLGANGKLKHKTLLYVKAGDGISSLDEVVKTESVKQKLVYATVTYTNNSDKEIKHMQYLGTLMLLEYEDEMYHIYDPQEQSGDGYDYVTWNGTACKGEMEYHSVSEHYGQGGNYIASLKPGESIQVAMAWIVNENVMDHMYLNLDSEGGSYEFSNSILKTGLVDIRQ